MLCHRLRTVFWPGNLLTRDLSGDDAAPHRIEHQLGGAVHVELLQNVRAVRFDGGHADRQQVGDILVAVSFGDQLKDFTFALRERLVAIDDPFLARWRR